MITLIYLIIGYNVKYQNVNLKYALDCLEVKMMSKLPQPGSQRSKETEQFVAKLVVDAGIRREFLGNPEATINKYFSQNSADSLVPFVRANMRQITNLVTQVDHTLYDAGRLEDKGDCIWNNSGIFAPPSKIATEKIPRGDEMRPQRSQKVSTERVRSGRRSPRKVL
jgi:hypothetical protein